MPPLRLIFALSFFFLAEANWLCTSVILGKGVDGTYPPIGMDTNYTAGSGCNITVGVPKGQYITINFTLTDPYNPNGRFLIYDETGTYFIWASQFSLPTTLQTAANVHIQILSNYTGVLSFSWHYTSVSVVDFPLPKQYATVTDEQGYVYNSGGNSPQITSVMVSNSPVSIFGGVNTTGPLMTLLNSQKILIYAGEGTNGTYLGSLYTIVSQNNPIIYNTSPYTVTVINTNRMPFDGGLLFRTSSSIQNLDYSFHYVGSTVNGDVALAFDLIPISKPTAATTIYNSGFANNFWLNYLEIKNNGQVDWLPGGYLPPTVPTLSWSSKNNLTTRPQLIPGIMKTIVANSSTSLMFTVTTPSSAVNYGDIGYFPSKNYRIPSAQQEESGGIVPSQVSYVMLTVISSYSHFETSQNGKNITQLKTGVPLTFYGMQTINFTYVPSGNSSDTGGLLRYDVIDPNVYTPPPETTTRVSVQLFTFLPAIIVSIVKLLS